MGWQPRDVVAGKIDRAFTGSRIAAYGHHERGFARAVCADQRDDFPLVDLEIDSLERHHAAIKGFDAAHSEKWRGHGSDSSFPSRVRWRRRGLQFCCVVI